jgi:uncharacterized iron-regulated membrane protein
VNDTFSPRRIGWALAAFACLMAIGTGGYRWSLHEPWLQ